jgi:hypothetical protein
MPHVWRTLEVSGGGDTDEEGAGEEDGRSLPVLHMATSELEDRCALLEKAGWI